MIVAVAVAIDNDDDDDADDADDADNAEKCNIETKSAPHFLIFVIDSPVKRGQGG